MMDWDAFERQVIGKPFAWNARGPDAYDCWGLVRAGLEQAGLLPFVEDWWIPEGRRLTAPVEILTEQFGGPRWALQERPEAGDVVVMSTHQRIHHIGLLTPSGVLQATQSLGVFRCPLGALRAQGYRRVECYRWA